MTTTTKTKQVFKSGYVTFLGRPNVGKSTLMNAFLEQKLAIVSPRPQTTRNRIMGIMHGPSHQVIFQDTPGLITPKYLLQQSMEKSVLVSVEEADILLVLLEATGIKEEDKKILELAQSVDKPKILVINKIDLVKKDQLLPMMADLENQYKFVSIVPVSGLAADGLQTLQQIIIDALPAGMPFYPEDTITNEPERFFVSEIIREQIFLRFADEIPYSTAVRIDEFKERPGRKDYLRAVIIVERESQKPILIGKSGKALKNIGSAARKEIERFLDRPVYLELHVIVQKKWRSDAKAIKRLGY